MRARNAIHGLVHRSVTSGRKHEIATVVDGAACQFAGAIRARRGEERDFAATRFEYAHGFVQTRTPGALQTTGIRIENDSDTMKLMSFGIQEIRSN